MHNIDLLPAFRSDLSVVLMSRYDIQVYTLCIARHTLLSVRFFHLAIDGTWLRAPL